MDHCLPGSSVPGVLQEIILEWVAKPSYRGSSPPKDRTCISSVSCTDKWVFYHRATKEAPYTHTHTHTHTHTPGISQPSNSQGVVHPKNNKWMLDSVIPKAGLLKIIQLQKPIIKDKYIICKYAFLAQFSSVQSLSRVRLFVTQWIAARQASLSITISQSSLELTSIESVMPSSHLILCRPLLLLHPIPPSIRVFSNESTLRIRWPKYWSFSFSISPSKEHPGLISFRMDWLDLLAVQGTLKSLLQHHSSKASILRRSVFFTVQGNHTWVLQPCNQNSPNYSSDLQE